VHLPPGPVHHQQGDDVDRVQGGRQGEREGARPVAEHEEPHVARQAAEHGHQDHPVDRARGRDDQEGLQADDDGQAAEGELEPLPQLQHETDEEGRLEHDAEHPDLDRLVVRHHALVDARGHAVDVRLSELGRDAQVQEDDRGAEDGDDRRAAVLAGPGGADRARDDQPARGDQPQVCGAEDGRDRLLDSEEGVPEHVAQAAHDEEGAADEGQPVAGGQ
jgi:hypothetical protein